MLNFQNKYLHRIKIKEYKQRDFKTFKKVIPLEVFKNYYIKDFYSPTQRETLRKFLNVRPELLHIFLIKRYLLERVVEKKYYFMISPSKMFPNRFLKIKNRYFRRKKRKKNLKLRFKFFFRYNYDNFLFYLTIFNKQFIIKPFNFLNALFYYKTRNFRKLYKIRPSKRKRFSRFLFLFNRRKRRRIRFVRRRIRYLKYRFKKKSVMKRFTRIKIRRIQNLFKFIAFFHPLKQKKLLVDDNFKIKSILTLPYKLLKFNFNKISNSYSFFINFRQRRQKIKIFNNIDNTTILKNEKIKLYDDIKLILKNKLIINKKKKIKKNKKKKLKELIFFHKKKKLKKIKFFHKKKKNKKIKFFHKKKKIKISHTISYKSKVKLLKKNKKLNFLTLDFDLDFLSKYLKNEAIKSKEYVIKNTYFPDYLILTSFLKKNLNKFKFSKNKKNIYNLMIIVKKINKLSKNIFFFKNKLNKFILKKKKNLSRLFLKLLIINKKKRIINKFNNYKQIIFNLLYIIKQFKTKLKEFILNFYIIYNKLNYSNNNIIDKNNKNFFFLKKIFYYLKRKKVKSKLKNKRKLIFSFLFFKKRFLFSKSKRFIFSYNNKLNNKFLKPWRKKIFLRKKYRRQKRGFLRRINKNFYLSSFYLYKNYFNKKKLLKNNFYSHFCNKKFKFIYLNFLKKTNLNYSKIIQINKNIDFLQQKII
jgi:hypothetical protein